jgi:hypothetical protein
MRNNREAAIFRSWHMTILLLIGFLVGACEERMVVSPFSPTVRGFDSAALSAAIARAQRGETVKLPEGNYAITEPIKLKSGTRLIGAGQDKTIIHFSGENPGVMISLAGCEDIVVAHLTLDGENNPNVQQGISGGNARRLKIHHVTIRNLVKSKAFGPHGILFSGRNPTRENGVTDSEISDCTIENIGLEAKFGGGIRLAWGSSRNRVLRNVIRNTGRGGIFGDNGSNDLVIQGNTVSGSGGEGLGIEVWGHCDRAVIEDNRIDHWLSIGGSDFCAVRRNTVEDKGGTTKPYGLEVIGSHCVVTDNVVDHNQGIGISVSSKMAKNYHFYAYNTIRRCYHWGAQLQGEEGGIAYHYFYRCKFLETQVGNPAVRYKGAEGNGFRTNGNVKHVVLEECEFCDNERHGIQLGGPGVDFLNFVRCAIKNNKGSAVVGPLDYTALEWTDCVVQGNRSDQLPPAKPFPGPAPTASFDVPAAVRAGESVEFISTSKSAKGGIAAVLWDFDDGIPSCEHRPKHTYTKPGEYRVTLIAWDDAGRGARAERLVRVVDQK